MGQNQVIAYPLKEVSCMSSGSNKCLCEFFGQGSSTMLLFLRWSSVAAT
jgi:hypothetical protein